MTIPSIAGPNDRQAMLDGLDLDAAEFLGGALKERVTVRNPNGGVRTEVPEIVVGRPGSSCSSSRSQVQHAEVGYPRRD